MGRMIRAIFFDLDGTLFDRGSARRRYGLDLIQRRPGAFPSRRDVADLLDMIGQAADLDEDRRAFGCRIARRFPGLGMTDAEVANDLGARIAGFVRPDPRIARLLTALSKRHRLAIVSNGSGRVQRAKLARLSLGDATPRAFISGEVGVAKPEPALFESALAWADCAASEALFVGDDPVRDIAGASGIGMATCWISGGRPYPAGLPQPDRTIVRVHELGEVVA
jgi:putative hydrolase of the HAD superfamily